MVKVPTFALDIGFIFVLSGLSGLWKNSQIWVPRHPSISTTLTSRPPPAISTLTTTPRLSNLPDLLKPKSRNLIWAPRLVGKTRLMAANFLARRKIVGYGYETSAWVYSRSSMACWQPSHSTKAALLPIILLRLRISPL